MPVLYRAPAGFKTVAIVEGWGTAEQQDGMLTTMRQKACETGADALLILSDQGLLDPTNRAYEDEGTAGGVAGEPAEHKEHVAKNCEGGHSGCYIDSYAIVRAPAK